MLIKAGTKLTVKHSRKGTFEGIAEKDFDTETTEFYPIITLEYVCGIVNKWLEGERISCRKSLCAIVPHE